MIINLFDFFLCSDEESHVNGQAETDDYSSTIHHGSMYVEAVLRVTRRQLNKEIGHHQSCSNCAHKMALLFKIVEGSICCTQGQSKDHHSDSHKVDAEQAIVGKLSHRVEQMVKCARH